MNNLTLQLPSIWISKGGTQTQEKKLPPPPPLYILYLNVLYLLYFNKNNFKGKTVRDNT